jgi:uncharacterized protein
MSKLNRVPCFPSPRSHRTQLIARWFGLRPPPTPVDRGGDSLDVLQLIPSPGQITLLTGASGSGKTSLLHACRDACESSCRWVDVEDIHPGDLPLVDCFAEVSIEDALRVLSAVGLAEAWTYLRTPAELSEGQRWRLKLALAIQACRGAANEDGAASLAPAVQAPASMEHLRPVLLIDEFAAILDRVTAMIIARTLRRCMRAPLSALVATSHDDLLDALQPDRVARCDFGSTKVLVRRTEPRS